MSSRITCTLLSSGPKRTARYIPLRPRTGAAFGTSAKSRNACCDASRSLPISRSFQVASTGHVAFSFFSAGTSASWPYAAFSDSASVPAGRMLSPARMRRSGSAEAMADHIAVDFCGSRLEPTTIRRIGVCGSSAARLHRKRIARTGRRFMATSSTVARQLSNLPIRTDEGIAIPDSSIGKLVNLPPRCSGTTRGRAEARPRECTRWESVRTGSRPDGRRDRRSDTADRSSRGPARSDRCPSPCRRWRRDR